MRVPLRSSDRLVFAEEPSPLPSPGVPGEGERLLRCPLLLRNCLTLPKKSLTRRTFSIRSSRCTKKASATSSLRPTSTRRAAPFLLLPAGLGFEGRLHFTDHLLKILHNGIAISALIMRLQQCDCKQGRRKFRHTTNAQILPDWLVHIQAILRYNFMRTFFRNILLLLRQRQNRYA